MTNEEDEQFKLRILSEVHSIRERLAPMVLRQDLILDCLKKIESKIEEFSKRKGAPR